jgi:hypothetical protein
MQPLARQQTRTSIHSWWSDRNPGPHGPTINLHAAAKPLIKIYVSPSGVRNNQKESRQAALEDDFGNIFLIHAVCGTFDLHLDFVNRCCRLGYVSRSTKVAILHDLGGRVASEADARAIVESPVLDSFVEMLRSPDTGIQGSSCMLLASLAQHECAVPTKGCEMLMSLLR